MNVDTRVLFDPPGPRGRRRIAIATALSLVVIGALLWLAVAQFARNGQLAPEKWAIFLQWPIVKYLLNGALYTIEVTGVCALITAPLGVLFALARLADNRAVRWLAGAYVEVFRALPLLLVIYMFLIVLPRFGLTFPIFWQLAIPIVLHSSAALAEVVRAGVLALPQGQSEAAYSMGLSYWQTMRLVVLPQALRNLAPALVSQLIQLLKQSTLGYVVSYLELLYAGAVLSSYTAQYVMGGSLIQTYLIIAAFFILVNYSLSRLALAIERRPARRTGRHGTRSGESGVDTNSTLAAA